VDASPGAAGPNPRCVVVADAWLPVTRSPRSWMHGLIRSGRLPAAGVHLGARAVLSIAATAALAGAAAPCATAAPPDYSAYRAVDPQPFQTFDTYGGAGAQFTSPSGQLCRIVIISRGEFAYAECFGDLHGSAEGNNLVRIGTSGTTAISKTTRDAFLGTARVGPDGVTRTPTGEGGFVPLPAGSSVTYTSSVWSGICAVDAASTSCTVTPAIDGTSKSFVLTATSTTTD
jgi:hypothetical protein